MTSRTVRGFLASVVIALAGAAHAANPQINAIETEGNLKPAHNLDCIAIGQVKNVYTPADLIAAYARCTRAERYDDAMVLMLIAGTYSAFDIQRVADNTAHDAYQAMMANIPPDEKTMAAMQQEFARYKAQGSPQMAKFCVDIKRLGPPNYYPGYMIAHGMGAVIGGGGNGLVANFDAHKAWKESIDKYMHCSVADMR